ncbi:F-box and leucine-rich repeat protein 4 [Rhizopus stolonifer]|uniref:F-box and leucine-rich repeat protein 4 n=1 Tax=Rhizopus stolonifer TaxID=4846 RepID=A0A367KFC7_RHIST|nr:F-box and leucine-rich repeat protein 4 [Rhizopus stolonifer]
MSRFDELPREIISLICTLLKQPEKYNCIFVNKEFHDAAIPELWREPILPTTTVLKKLIRCLKISRYQRGECIRTIKLGYKVSLNDDELLALIQLVPNLEVLELRKADELTDKSIKHVSRYCAQLKSFGVTNALITYRSAHYLGLCQHLKKLTLASCPNLSSMALLPFVSHKIEYLDLSGCKWLNVTDTAYDLASFQYLTHLNLVCCDVINTDFIHHITEHPCLTHLQDFSLTGGAVIEDIAIIPFVRTHPNIRGLFLLECAITDHTLDAIATHLPLLHNLDLSFCRRLTAQGVRRLISNCHNLRLLGLKDCGMIQNNFPEIPSTIFPAITENYPHLNTLSYVELGYIRAAQETNEDSDTEMAENETLVMDEQEESLSETYGYIQHYLNTN